MSRYIDADKLKYFCRNNYFFERRGKYKCKDCTYYAISEKRVKELPTEDVVPIKYIDWLYVNGSEYGVYKCSKCGKYQTYKSNFCEDCGGEYIERNKDEE